MGNSQTLSPICGKFVGEGKEGETRLLRNANLQDGESLISNYNEMDNLSKIFEFNYKQSP